MSYEVRWKRSAEKELRRLPAATITRLLALAEGLEEDPFPTGCRKLQGSERSYRVRSGDYRMVYTVEGTRLLIEIIRVGHRREVYR